MDDLKEVSIKQLLEMTVDLIGNIEVPVMYGDKIARPLCIAISNIEQCIAAIPETKEGEADV